MVVWSSVITAEHFNCGVVESATEGFIFNNIGWYAEKIKNWQLYLYELSFTR